MTGNPGLALPVFACMGLLFFMLTTVHELLRLTIGVNLYPLYILGAPALAGLILSNGFPRALGERPVLYWTGLCIWMALAVPFSSWAGGSAVMLGRYLRNVYFILLLVAGLIVSWRDCRRIMYALAASAAAFVFVAWTFQRVQGNGRVALEFGTLRNSNDLAAALILLLPFLLWLVLTSRAMVLRIAAFVLIILGLSQILHSGSRGAFLALAVGALFWLFRATPRQRVAAVLLVPLAAVFVLAIVPRSALRRATRLSQSASGYDEATLEADESAQLRLMMLRKSIEYTFRFPLFGVGPGQFVNYEGMHNIIPGMSRGAFRVTHNAYTQVSSECGIPGLLFFLAAIIGTFRKLNRVYREARARPDCQDIRVTAFCLMLSMAGFCTAIVFLSLAFTVYLPVMTGVAIAVARAVPDEFRARATAPPSPNPPGYSGQFGMQSPSGPAGLPVLRAADRSLRTSCLAAGPQNSPSMQQP